MILPTDQLRSKFERFIREREKLLESYDQFETNEQIITHPTRLEPTPYLIANLILVRRTGLAF